MPKVEIYTQPFCGYCTRAKRLLDRKGIAYEEIDVMMTPSRRSEMIRRADGRTTTPQIFIDDQGVGGCDELMELDASGQLDPLLGISGAAP
ncbi:MAG TPA: glutaredoxin 3 [Alphaproteobacteria bacterium]|nr:glutaredoxin 3 [Alphaproteobacteria bacterium]